VLAMAVIFHVSNRNMGMNSSGLPRTACLRSTRTRSTRFLSLRRIGLQFSAQLDKICAPEFPKPARLPVVIAL
jgi:hypothetical protein